MPAAPSSFEGHLLIELVVLDEQDARTLQREVARLGARSGHGLAALIAAPAT